MEAQKRAQDNPPFSATRERFEGLLGVVGSEEWLAMTHADMEGALMVAGRELMRTFYEELLAVRAAATVVEPVVGSDGVERTHVRSRVRRLTSVFGEVEARRDGYSARGTFSLFPVDGALNLPRESYSLGLRRMVAVEAATLGLVWASRCMKGSRGPKPLPLRSPEFGRSTALRAVGLREGEGVGTRARSGRSRRGRGPGRR